MRPASCRARLSSAAPPHGFRHICWPVQKDVVVFEVEQQPEEKEAGQSRLGGQSSGQQSTSPSCSIVEHSEPKVWAREDTRES